MCHYPTAAFLQRETRLGSVEGLDFAFFVQTQNQRLVWRIQAKPNYIAELLHKTLVLRHLEGSDPMRLQAVGVPNPRYSHMAHSDLLGHFSFAQIRCIGRTNMQRLFHYEFHSCGLSPTRARAMRSILRNPGRARFGDAVAPQNNSRPRRAQAFGDGVIRDAVGGQKANPGPHGNPLRRCPRFDPGFQSHPLL